MRNSLTRYEEENVTPADIPVLIMDHSRLNITARNKLGAAQTTSTSYSFSTSQTFKLDLDDNSSYYSEIPSLIDSSEFDIEVFDYFRFYSSTSKSR